MSNNYLVEEAQCIRTIQNSRSCLIPLSEGSKFDLARILHELTHVAMDYIFSNNEEPYLSKDTVAIEEYQLKSKRFIANSIKPTGIVLNMTLVAEPNLILLDIRNELLNQKDILIYSVPKRIEFPIKVDLLTELIFKNMPLSESSKTKFLNNLYHSKKLEHNVTSEAEIILERVSDWLTYPHTELSKEIIPRFVELSFRQDELANLKYILIELTDYWITHISPTVDSLMKNVTQCEVVTVDATGNHLQSDDII